MFMLLTPSRLGTAPQPHLAFIYINNYNILNTHLNSLDSSFEPLLAVSFVVCCNRCAAVRLSILLTQPQWLQI